MTDIPEYTPAQQNDILQIARLAATNALSMKRLDPSDSQRFPPYLLETHGCFVSMHHRETGELRGCIGTFDRDQPLVLNLLRMGEAVTRDPRFELNCVTIAELPDLEIEVSILMPYEAVTDPLTEIEIGEHGIYLTAVLDGRNISGTFLPSVAIDQDWDIEQTLSALCEHKLGLPAEAWREPDRWQIRFYRYACVVITEASPGVSAGVI